MNSFLPRGLQKICLLISNSSMSLVEDRSPLSGSYRLEDHLGDECISAVINPVAMNCLRYLQSVDGSSLGLFIEIHWIISTKAQLSDLTGYLYVL